MSPHPRSLLWIMIFGALLVEPSARGQVAIPEGQPVLPPLPIPKAVASSDHEAPQSPAVKNLRLLLTNGGRVDWSVQGDWIAFDKRGDDGFYDLYVMKPDTSLERCLTCRLLEFRKTHAYNPSWHPSGKLLAFQAQRLARKLKLDASEMATPDRGLHSQLWTISMDGEVFLQLTSNDSNRALLDPNFSHEGTLLAWSERARSRIGRWGEWQIRVAKFNLRAQVPRLKKVKTYRPGERRRFVVAHGFSPDDKRLLVSGNLARDQPEAGMDIYLLDLESRETSPLTQTFSEWDQQAQISPNGVHVAWSSNRNLPRTRAPAPPGIPFSARPQRRELWIQNLDGSGQERLTFFNHPSSFMAEAGATVADFAWGPEGNSIVLQVVTDFVGQKEALYLLELHASE